MKIDSPYLDIEINPLFFTIEGKTKIDGKTIEIWDDGDICLCSEENEVMLHVDELEEIIRVFKLYRDRRTVYLAQK